MYHFYVINSLTKGKENVKYKWSIKSNNKQPRFTITSLRDEA